MQVRVRQGFERRFEAKFLDVRAEERHRPGAMRAAGNDAFCFARAGHAAPRRQSHSQESVRPFLLKKIHRHWQHLGWWRDSTSKMIVKLERKTNCGEMH
jgi:hypothetical protein